MIIIVRDNLNGSLLHLLYFIVHDFQTRKRKIKNGKPPESGNPLKTGRLSCNKNIFYNAIFRKKNILSDYKLLIIIGN